MRTRTLITAIMASASLIALSGSSDAQTKTPTQADFDACNRVAEARMDTGASGGSALPRSGSTGISGGATSPGPGSGASTSTMPDSSTSPGGSPPTPRSLTVSGSSTGSGMSGGSMADHTLPGMDASGRSDPTYEQAYRDCMKGRGF